ESTNGGLAGELVSGLEIWINPLANPDGMYRDNDTILFPIRANSAGYDLNRNFPDPENPTSPVLQKETLDMMRFMEEKRFVLSANLHGGEEVINYPWDKWTRTHADDRWFDEISRRYADTVHLHAEPGYLTFLDNGVTRGSVWYVIRGGRQDYITWGLGGREVTMELDKTKQTPATELENLWNWNKRSLLRYLGEALYGVKGTVTDALTGAPMAAKLFINGHDIDSSHVYSDTLSGEFYRFLSPGIYTLTFSSPGYISYSTEITISEWTSSVSLDVQLEEIKSVYPAPPESGLLIYPNPSPGGFVVLPPTVHAGGATVTIASLSGQVIDTRHIVTLPGIPEPIDCSHLPPGIYIVTYNKDRSGSVLRGKVVIWPFISR
ncbi:MAG: T9SS type A sorting domain-containing protein, partial [Bacteroidales bacterium]|nr:T9SS type A sorting domain-containing protein [Bacteroidales bacterium]